MPMYAYKGVGPTGKATSGVRDAESPKALRQIMRRDGVVVTSQEISTKGGAAAAARAGAPQAKGLSRQVDLGGLFGRVKKTEIAAFTRETSTLLRAGLPLSEALGSMFDQTLNLRLKVPLGQIRTAVNEGSSFADSLAQHLGPAAGGGAEVDDGHPRAQELVLLVELEELEGRP